MAFAFISAGTGTIPGGQNGGTSASLDTTGATLLVVVTAEYNGGGGSTVSDNKSNTWNVLTFKDGGESRVIITYAKNPTVGTGHTFTTFGGSIPFVSGVVQAFSGADTTSPFDVQNGNAAVSGTTVQPNSVTPSQDNSLIVTGIGAGPATTISSIDSSYTITNTVNYSAGVNEGVSGAYLIQGSAGLSNPTWTIANPNANGFAAVIAVFKPGAGGGGGSAPGNTTQFFQLMGVGT